MTIYRCLCITCATLVVTFKFSYADVPELKLPPVTAVEKAEKNK